MPLSSICVYCGSNPGRRPDYTSAARQLGELIARRGLTLVYGGGDVGMMGAAADGAVAAGGRVIGIIPGSLLRKEVAHAGISDLRVVGSMHERKAQMVESSDAFIALPGGLGTLDELFEVWTWAQLGFHRKPIGLLDINGFFQPLIAYLDHAVAEGFLRPQHRGMLLVDTDAGRLMDAFESWSPPSVEKWVEKRRQL